MQKAGLIEKIAALLEEKKLPLLADIRDRNSTEDVRLVLEPKTRNVEAEMLMEQLPADQARIRVPLDVDVLDPHGVPRVMNLKEALQAFLDHRRVVLRSRAITASRRSPAEWRSCACPVTSM